MTREDEMIEAYSAEANSPAGVSCAAAYGSVGRCVSHHHACDCRERAFMEALAAAQDTMEAYATRAELDEWHCRVEDLIGTAYPRKHTRL